MSPDFNTLPPIVGALPRKFACVRPVSENASAQILVTLAGMVMEVRAVFSNALLPILVILAGMVIEVKFVAKKA